MSQKGGLVSCWPTPWWRREGWREGWGQDHQQEGQADMGCPRVEGKLRLQGITALPPVQSCLVLSFGACTAPKCLNFPSGYVGSGSLRRGNKCLSHSSSS